MSQHKTGYVISYLGILCHNMSYVTTIAASLHDSSYFYIYFCRSQVVHIESQFSYCISDYPIEMYSNFVLQIKLDFDAAEMGRKLAYNRPIILSTAILNYPCKIISFCC